MRGTPFLKEGFTGGLNTIASPYSIGENECRECLNVVSTANGAIRKRNGTSIFSTGPFPAALGVTDTLLRTENPLSNAGKWAAWKGATGLTNVAVGYKIGEGSKTVKPFRVMYWNVAEQTNPAVSIEFIENNGGIMVAACLSNPGVAKSGYFWTLSAVVPKETGKANLAYVLIRMDEGAETVLVEGELTEFLPETAHLEKYKAGITVRGGKVKGWIHPNGGTWQLLSSVTDTTYKKGYSGMGGSSSRTGHSAANFSTGEYTETPFPGEVISLGSVNVTSGRYMIAQAGTEIFSVNEGGIYTKIGSCTEGAPMCIVQAPESTAVASQGPVYMMNGVDAPKYWTGATSATALVEWTGIAATSKFTNGTIEKGYNWLKSATAKFEEEDVGLQIIFTTAVKAKTNEASSPEIEVKEAEILEVQSAEVVTLVMPEDSFWNETKTAEVHFELRREYYEDATSKKHIPNGKYMIFAENRIWVTGISDDPSAVRFSGFATVAEGGEQADPSAWPKNNLVRFDHSDGLPITALGGVGPYIGVFKQRKTWMIHDAGTGANRKLSDQIGCVANKSVVNTAIGTFFLTADQGIYLTNGSTLHELSYNVRPTILKATTSVLQTAAGAYWNNHYYLSYATDGGAVPTRTLDYDVYLKSWWLHDVAPRSWCVFEPNAGESTLFGTQTNTPTGAVVKMFVSELYTDSGENYKGNGTLGAFWTGPWEPFAYYVFRHRIKAPFLKKRVRQIFFDGEGEIIPYLFKNFSRHGTNTPASVNAEPQSEPTLPVNFEQGETVFGNTDEEQTFGGHTYKGQEMIFGGAATTQAARLYAPGVGRVWGVGFGNNSAEGFEVDSYAYFAQFRKS